MALQKKLSVLKRKKAGRLTAAELLILAQNTKPVSRARELFLPMHRLILRQAGNLSPRQLNVLAEHKFAVEISRRSGGNDPGKSARSVASTALQAVLNYYNLHRRINVNAYSNLRTFAEKHWHHEIVQAWPHEFTSATSNLGIRLKGQLRRRVASERERYIAEVAERVAAQEKHKL